MKLNAIAVDDEPLALDIIEDYVDRIPYVSLVTKCENALDAISAIRSESIDLIFLDIHLPDLSGFEMLETLSLQPQIIFTTAYESYALESYEVNAIDYLLKPFSFPRFLKAVEKATYSTGVSRDTTANSDPFIFVHAGSKTLKLMLDDIALIEGYSDYTIIRTSGKKLLVRDNLRHIAAMLRGRGFIRIHRSYIIPIRKIASIETNMVRVLDQTIPIGKLYRTAFFKEIETNIIG